jgi:hypothetical protein
MSNANLPSCLSDSDGEDGRSSTGSADSTDTAATSVHSVDFIPSILRSGSDKIPNSVQSHASRFRFTDAELWNLHANNRAVIPGATGPPGTCLPEAEPVSSDAAIKHLESSSSPDEHTYIWGSCVSFFDPGAELPIARHATRMSVCLNDEDHQAGLTYLTTPGFDSAHEVAATCSDRFGHLIERVVSAVNHTGLSRKDAFSQFETLLSSQIRGKGTKAQFQEGYDRVEDRMNAYIDKYWKATLATNPSAAIHRRQSSTNQTTWAAISQSPDNTWVPDSDAGSEE